MLRLPGAKPKIVIAEVKPESPPFPEAPAWRSDYSWDELFEIANEVGDMISIHTDPHWGGSLELVTKARRLTNKPIVAKAVRPVNYAIEQAFAAGADLPLTFEGPLRSELQERCLIEPFDIGGLHVMPLGTMAVWNARDLQTGGLKKTSFDEARQIFSGWLCQASNIARLEDVHPGADAVLIGRHLPEVAEAIRSQR